MPASVSLDVKSVRLLKNWLVQASGKLVLYLRDINMPKADKYGTSQVMAFLQQLLTYQGFYNDKLEFIGKLLPPWLRPVKVCCSVI